MFFSPTAVALELSSQVVFLQSTVVPDSTIEVRDETEEFSVSSISMIIRTRCGITRPSMSVQTCLWCSIIGSVKLTDQLGNAVKVSRTAVTEQAGPACANQICATASHREAHINLHDDLSDIDF